MKIVLSRFLRARIACAIVCLCSAAAFAAEYYVAPTTASPAGSDDNPGTAAAPFATIAKAITTANTAIDGGEASATIHLASGTYTERGLSLANPIRIVGDGATRTDVTVNGNNTSPRVFSLSNAGASLENLSVKNGRNTDKQAICGGNVYMTAGVVTNCWIYDGKCNDNAWNRGANIYMTGGTVVDSLVSGGKNLTQGRGAVGYQLAATGGHVLRTEFKDGSYASGNETRGSICPVHLDGAVIFENCYLHNLQCYQCSCSDNNHGVGRGTIYVNNANAKVVNCTIVGNKAVGPGASCSGIYLNAAGTVVNCVMYKNLNSSNADGAEQEWGNRNGANFTYCALGSGLSSYPSGTGNVTTLTDDAFVNVSSGDYSPKVGSPLIDAGSDSAYTTAGAVSTTDFAQLPRVSPAGQPIDIGAYERQSAGLVVVGNAASEFAILGSPLAFTGEASDAAGTVTYTWNFGDGTEPVVTTEKTVNYIYAQRGQYTVTVFGSDGMTTTSPYTLTRKIRVAPGNLYVATTGTDDDAEGRGMTAGSPYATIAYALSQLTTDSSPTLAGVNGVTIHLADGTYTQRGFTLAAGIRVVGDGATRADVVVNGDSGGRVFTLQHADAALVNLTVQNGKNGATGSGSESGANVYMTAGMVTNCVVRGGNGDGNGWNLGANILMKGGTVVDSLLIGGGNATAGRSAIGYQVAASGGHVVRCEFKDGTYTSGGAQGSVCPVYLYGDVVFENSYLHNLESRQCKCKGTYCDDEAHGQGHRGLGAICVDSANAKVVNCTVIGNKAVNDAAHCSGIYLNAAGMVVNCALYKNVGSTGLDGAAQEWGNVNGASFTSCAFGEGLAAYPAAESNVTNLTDAAFKDYAQGNLCPSSGSPLVGRGDNAIYTTVEGLSTLDFVHKPRKVGRRVDIGAWEGAASGFTLLVR